MKLSRWARETIDLLVVLTLAGAQCLEFVDGFEGDC